MATQFNSGHLLPEHRPLFLDSAPAGWRPLAGDYGCSITDRLWLKRLLHDFRGEKVCLCPAERGFEVFTEKPYIKMPREDHSASFGNVERRSDL